MCNKKNKFIKIRRQRKRRNNKRIKNITKTRPSKHNKIL